MDNQKNNFSGNDFEFDKNSELDVLFKKALQNHAVPTEDHVWRRIQHGLADKKGETALPITKTMTKRSSLPIWSAVSGVAASLLIWAVFFAPSTQNNLNSSDTVANSDKIEIINGLNKTENSIPILADNSLNSSENKEENQNTDATSLQVIASKKQQIPPTITIKNTTSKNKIKNIDINEAVARLEKDQSKIKNQNSQDRLDDKTFMTPSTLISDNVWASDFVVHNPTVSIKKEKNNADTYQLNVDNQTVAITIKVGKNENFDTSQATGFDANTNPSQFDKTKNILKEVWNLKTGKKVNLQNILPNNENEKATDKTTTNQSISTTEIHAD